MTAKFASTHPNLPPESLQNQTQVSHSFNDFRVTDTVQESLQVLQGKGKMQRYNPRRG